MKFNLSDRYRCTIIRGKAQNQIEDLIPIYCNIISKYESINHDYFIAKFYDEMDSFLPKSKDTNKSISDIYKARKKTIDNHRSEISHKLYGLYYIDTKNNVYLSKRAKEFIEGGDLTKLFKSLVDLFQQPNGMEKSKKVNEKLERNISIKPYHFVMALLVEAEKHSILLTKNEISFYVFDTLVVLQGKVKPHEIISQIISDRNANIEKKIIYFDNNGHTKSSSYCYQHTNEQLNILELTGAIIIKGNLIHLNDSERVFIEHLISQDPTILNFAISKYSTDLEKKWDLYYNAEDLTSMKSLVPQELKNNSSTYSTDLSLSTVDIGNIGEELVYEFEKNRISQFNKRLTNKVIKLGKQRGLGYDIQSIWGRGEQNQDKHPDAAYYIEVKTTKRITKPKFLKNDKFTLTRNEWLAAEQHKDNFAIFRVYLTRDETFVHKIFNPLSCSNAFCAPINYNYEFDITEEFENWT